MHIIRSAYPGISEEEILWWHDWNWIHSTIDRIQTDRREERRWGLLALYHAGAATGMSASEKTSKGFTELYDSLTSEQEAMARYEAELAQKNEALRKQNERKSAPTTPDGVPFGPRKMPAAKPAE